MASATLTILGLYNWLQSKNVDLFSELVLPADVDENVLVNNILMQSAPFESVYSDADVLRELIGVWSDAHVEMWEKWAEAWSQALEFNPMENFDRTEHEEIKNSGKDTVDNTETRNLAGSDQRTANLQTQETRNLTDERTANLTDADTKNLQTQKTLNLTDAETKNLSDEHKVSAYDSSTYAQKDLDTHTGTDNFTHTGTDTVNETGTDTIVHSGTDTMRGTGTDTVNETGTDTHSTTDTGTVRNAGETNFGKNVTRDARYHGNIGVTSLSSLLNDWLDVSEKWDIYAKITQDFIREFCVMVY